MLHESLTKQSSRFIIQSEGFTDNDIQQLVDIHRKEIQLGFLTSLGDCALNLLFTFASKSKYSFLLAVKDEVRNKHVGFLLGTIDTGAFYKDFFVKKLFIALYAIFPKLFSLATVRKITEVLLYPCKKDMQLFPDAELLDIAIYSQYQGRGLAKKLFKEFSEKLLRNGTRKFKITTGEKLHNAQQFYESLGAVKTAVVEVHKGQKTIVYVYTNEE